jgi:hypothetical protein
MSEPKTSVELDPRSAAFGEHTGGKFYECIDGATCSIHGQEPDITKDPSGYDAFYERHPLCDYGAMCLDQPYPYLICEESEHSCNEERWPCEYAQGVIAGVVFAAAENAKLVALVPTTSDNGTGE